MSRPTLSAGRLDRRGIANAGNVEGGLLGLERVAANADRVSVLESRVVLCCVIKGRVLEDGA